MIICSSIIRNRKKTIHHRFLLSCTLACHCSCLLYCPMLLLLHTTVAATATVWYSCLLLSLCRRALCIKLSLPQILFQRRHMCFMLKIQTQNSYFLSGSANRKYDVSIYQGRHVSTHLSSLSELLQ